MSKVQNQLSKLKRQLLVEKSLDRIRDHTMKMTSSSELANVIKTVFQEATKLKFGANACDLVIFDKASGGAEFWISGDLNEKVIYARIPRLRIKHYQDSLSAWKTRKKLRSVELKGKSCKTYMRQIIEKSEESNMPDHIKKLLLNLDSIYHTEAFTKHGLFRVASDGPLQREEESILKRFANVFEQTYTRFLDLQKAEEQAREAEIELALERVRARTMAMHQSHELREVVLAMYEQMETIGLAKWGCAIMIFHEDTTQIEYWLAEETGSNLKRNYFVAGKKHPVYKQLWSFWKSQGVPLTLHHVDDEKRSFDQYWLNETDFKRLPEEVKTSVLNRREVFLNYASMRHGLLSAVSYERLSDDRLSVLARFAKVFEQAYTRFLDLQKVEVQAREAQIEAALERVRAASMAMHSSDKLSDLSLELVRQVQALGEETWFCAFNIYGDDPRGSLEWGSNGKGVFPKYRTPREGVFLRYYKSGQKGESFLVNEIGPDECPAHYEYLCSLPGVGDQLLKMKSEGIPFPESQIDHVAYFKYGYLLFITYKPVPELHDVFVRFARVFEQTYTRFLDLKKAEAQVREAQIEAALERVRASSMAMHQSDELNNVLSTMFFELAELDFILERCVIWIFNDEKRSFTWFSANPEGKVENYLIPYTNYRVVTDYRKFWKRRIPRKYYDLSGDLKKGMDDYLFKHTEMATMPKEVIRGMSDPDQIHIYNTFNDFGALFVSSIDPQHDEIFDILERFGNVFNQAYTRFLDIKKAEAQAREAQIEASLERIRAASLAMHESSELLNVITVISKQLETLGVPFNHCSFGQNNELEDFKFWTSVKGMDKPEMIDVPRINHPMTQRFKIIRKEKLSFYADTLTPKQHDRWNEHMFKHERMSWLTKEQRNRLKNTPFARSLVILPNIFLVVSHKHGIPFSEDENQIIRRVAGVFEQSYTRFLDLTRAEAQAREAQIEAALERVRSRSLGMHKTDELNELIGMMFSELKKLDVVLLRCVIVIYESNQCDQRWWMANSEDPDHPINLFIKHLELPPNKEFIKAWKKRLQKWVYYMEGDIKREWDERMLNETELSLLPESVKAGMRDPAPTYCNTSFNHFGCLTFIAPEPIEDGQFDILARFARVFDQSYTRFLDLKKVEAQAREAQIETALERVRSRSLAMHKSNELSKVAFVLFEQMRELGTDLWGTGFGFCTPKSSADEFWFANEKGILPPVIIPHTRDTTHREMYKGWKEKSDFKSISKGGKSLEKHYNYMLSLPDVRPFFQEFLDSGMSFPTWQQWNAAYFSHGYLLVITTSPYQDQPVLKRFAKVFEQAYTRFLDLKKAEAQAREAQIETALERVRAASMAMHASTDLGEVAKVMFDQLDDLGIETIRLGILIFHENKTMDAWGAMAGKKGKGNTLQIIGAIENKGHPILEGAYNTWKQKKKHFRHHLKGNDLNNYYKTLAKSSFKVPMKDMPKEQVLDQFHFAEGAIYSFTKEELDPASFRIFERFSNAFGQAYRRYLDIMRAEAQAREAKIEAALERIRAQATGMQKSEDLLDVVVTMRKEFVSLGNEAQYFWHMRWLPEKYEKAMTSGDGSRIGMVMSLPRHIHGDIKLVDNWEKSEETSLVFPMGPDVAVEYVDKMITLGDFERVDPNAPSLDDVRAIGGLTFVMARTTHGEIGYSLPGEVHDPPEEAVQTLVRFAGAFDLAYRRFEDLKSAEAREKEAIKQASLDRVRADIASMRAAKDLERITPVVWKELTTLGVPFFRCGVFIVDEPRQTVHAYLSKPSGKSLAALELAFGSMPLVNGAVEYWSKQQVYVEEWTKEEFIQWTEPLVEQGQISDSKKYQGGKDAPDHLVLQMVPFSQGMMYVGSEHHLTSEQLELVQSLSRAFSIAYTRYEDFVKLEDAKSKVEAALAELKSAQSQLVQAEKMASLGELTAGIAHEIQNPLNFVNNFAEVSGDLIEELKEELAMGNAEDVKEIAADLLQNLEKITHHGKRASGIVKGMLEHSRSGDGKKEPTDINALADEYLRLAYHGLRAKDKSFNADFKTEFDPNLPKVNVVPQDIGRVLLNLINNAFHAVSERAKKETSDYKPTVTVTTTMSPSGGGKGEEKVVIQVQDNGPGIPEHIKDKIFQPFFTTKATGEGTGLGLSLSYDIVTKGHGGNIEVVSKEGAGTAFVIVLPLV